MGGWVIGWLWEINKDQLNHTYVFWSKHTAHFYELPRPWFLSRWSWLSLRTHQNQLSQGYRVTGWVCQDLFDEHKLVIRRSYCYSQVFFARILLHWTQLRMEPLSTSVMPGILFSIPLTYVSGGVVTRKYQHGLPRSRWPCMLIPNLRSLFNWNYSRCS